MKAIGYQKALPISDVDSLTDIKLQKPTATGRDLLVNVKAISVNPVDFKVRQNSSSPAGEYKVLGWDAVGEVVTTGEDVEHFKVGDKVYYAGDLTRSGSNAEFQLVDERIVGKKPKSLSNANAAALPLTTITAWELLFDHLQLEKNTKQSGEILLVVGAAGGVGSILVQLAKTLTGATVIGTASRESSQEWLRELGVDHVIDHRKALKDQIEDLGFDSVTHVASLNNTEDYFETYVDVLRPFGKIGVIDDPKSLDIMKMKTKSLSLHIEFMFARSMHHAKDITQQHELLNLVSNLVDQGKLKTTIGKHLGNINAANLKKAHEILESRSAIGKIVLENFG